MIHWQCGYRNIYSDRTSGFSLKEGKKDIYKRGDNKSTSFHDNVTCRLCVVNGESLCSFSAESEPLEKYCVPPSVAGAQPPCS